MADKVGVYVCSGCGIGESVDDDDRIRRISGLVSFRYADQLFELWQASGGLSYAERDQACRAFVSGIPD